MIDPTWINLSYGMSLNPGPFPSRDNDNGVLFYLEYIMLKEATGQDVSEDVAAFKTIIENIRCYQQANTRVMGLYDRSAGDSLNPNRDNVSLISHDNLTAIAAFDYRYGDGKEGEYIARWGIPRMLYDNVQPSSQRLKTIQWPTDIMFWAWCSKDVDLRLLTVPAMFPLFMLRCIISNMGPVGDTSSKLLNFVRFYAGKDSGLIGKLLWKGYAATMRHQYGDEWVNALMSVYFQNPAHPNRAISAGLKL